MGRCKRFERKEKQESYGMDEISNEILQCCSPVIEPAIAAACNY